MKQLLYILFFLFISCSKTTDNKQLINSVRALKKVEPVATIKLADGTFINNAPSGRSWVAYNTVPGRCSRR